MELFLLEFVSFDNVFSPSQLGRIFPVYCDREIISSIQFDSLFDSLDYFQNDYAVVTKAFSDINANTFIKLRGNLFSFSCFSCTKLQWNISHMYHRI
jgi:hypothetical protein